MRRRWRRSSAGGFGAREVVVRVNGAGHRLGRADLAALAQAEPDAILVPKVSRADEVRRYDAAIAPPGVDRVWAMVETARSLFALEPIAAAVADTRLALFVMGTNDLAKEIGWRLGPGRAALHGCPVAGGRRRPRARPVDPGRGVQRAGATRPGSRRSARRAPRSASTARR